MFQEKKFLGALSLYYCFSRFEKFIKIKKRLSGLPESLHSYHG
ncbi:hypothetical protein CHCC20335_4478 [Bacillus paralicheniformis]|nr:hypothetical protein CHCC20335_4478 [Bacillus paralicheniformis]